MPLRCIICQGTAVGPNGKCATHTRGGHMGETGCEHPVLRIDLTTRIDSTPCASCGQVMSFHDWFLKNREARIVAIDAPGMKDAKNVIQKAVDIAMAPGKRRIKLDLPPKDRAVR